MYIYDWQIDDCYEIDFQSGQHSERQSVCLEAGVWHGQSEIEQAIRRSYSEV